MGKPEKLILDYSKWRCGGDYGDNVLGAGECVLLNDSGYMCCLGQWSQQLGATYDDMINKGDPAELKHKISLFVDTGITSHNSQLSNDCIDINDNSDTTTDEKITLLENRLMEEGIKLEVINKP